MTNATKGITTSRGKYGAVILTEKQEAWLQKHFKHTKNEEIAERFGISPRSVNRLASKRGLKKSKQFLQKSREAAAAKANRLHRINGTYPPKGYRIPRSEESWFKKGERPIDRIGGAREAERIAKAAATRKELFRLEKARALYGLPRETKMKVVRRPRKQIWMRHYLKTLGYIIERGGFIAYYNKNTKRSLELESRPMTGFTFIEQQAHE